MKKILVVGGGGYIWICIVPELLRLGYSVTVYDLFIYGKDVLDENEKLNVIKGDIRDLNLLNKITLNHDVVIHLACISNDPSFELNPTLGKSINLDSFRPFCGNFKKKII